jgi:hypothetical protein
MSFTNRGQDIAAPYEFKGAAPVLVWLSGGWTAPSEMMAVLGGVVPLLLPSPYFSEAIRWVHFAEVVSSNFVFGVLTGRAFAAAPTSELAAVPGAAPAMLAAADRAG